MDSPPHIKDRRVRAFTLVEGMMVTFISSFVFAGVLSAYIFLGRGLVRQGNEEQLESRTRVALYDFTQDMSGASAVITATGTVLSVSTWVPQTAPNPPVLGTATYTYDPVGGQLTLERNRSHCADQQGRIAEIVDGNIGGRPQLVPPALFQERQSVTQLHQKAPELLRAH